MLDKGVVAEEGADGTSVGAVIERCSFLFFPIVRRSTGVSIELTGLAVRARSCIINGSRIGKSRLDTADTKLASLTLCE